MFDYKTITGWEAACADQGKDPNVLPSYEGCRLTEGQILHRIAGHKLEIMHVSINKDKNGKEWQPKPGEARHYAWMWWEKDKSKPSGSGLSLCGVEDGASSAGVASRLTCRDEARAKFIFENNIDLFEDYIIFHP